MALTMTEVTSGPQSVGQWQFRVYDVTFDSSYPTGGEALTVAKFGFGEVLTVQAELGTTSSKTTSIAVLYDRTNDKLVAQWGNAGTASALPEVTNTTDLSTFTVRVTAYGR